MKHAAKWGFCIAMGLGMAALSVLSTDDASAQKKKPPPAATAQPAAVDPPTVKTAGGIILSPSGIRFGMSPDDLIALYERLIDADYAPLYRKAQPGPQTNRLDAEVNNTKAAFRRSKVNFDNLPTGIDSTPLKGEYSYRNQEMMMSITRRNTATRYFFFIKNKLWKWYDEVPLRANNPLGGSYEEAVKRYQDAFGVAGRVTQPDYSVNRSYLETDWQDGTTHLRLVDRSGLKFIGVVFEERSTVSNLASLRTAKAANTDSVDPDIAALVRPPSSAPMPPASADTKKKKK